MAAENLRHTARVVQQLMAALTVHLAFCTNDRHAQNQAQSRTSHPHTAVPEPEDTVEVER